MAYVPSSGKFKGQSFKNEYQYRKRRLKDAYDLTPSEYATARKSNQFQKDYGRFKQQKANKKTSVSYEGFFKQFVANRNPGKRRVISDDITQQAFEEGLTPTQSLALKDYLVLIGNRQEDDPWEVGETPKVQ